MNALKNVKGFVSGSYGNKIRIRHNDREETFYAHLKEGSISIKKGDTVTKGQVIGYMGNTGESYGAHLHFEYILDGVPVESFGVLNADLPLSVKKSVDEVAREVINGAWGNGEERKQKLESAGYNYSEVQAKVDEILAPTPAPVPVRKSNEQLASEVLAGLWGNGGERKSRLEAEGYDYNAVQDIVNSSFAKSPVFC